MKYPLDILLAGRSRPELEKIEQLLEQYGGIDLTTRVIENGHSDPLYNIQKLPEILIYSIGDMGEDGWVALNERPPSERPYTIVVGPDGDVSQFRAAMRAGARDYLTTPVDMNELAVALDQITLELRSRRSQKTADLMVVIDAKGGSGASVVATNLAHMNSAELQKKTILVDMDLQFGALPSYLNLTPNNGLIKALEDVDNLDAVAIDGIVLKHEGGLRVLAASQDEMLFNEEVPVARIATLFRLLGETYDEIVVDIPRQIDPINSLILQHADRIVLVMEASLAHVRDAKRLLHILNHVLSLPQDRIQIVVNRYDKNGSVRLSDIRDTMATQDIVTLPSDFKRVNDSINAGSPLLDSARGAQITKSILGLAKLLRGPEHNGATSKRSSRLFSWARPSRSR